MIPINEVAGSMIGSDIPAKYERLRLSRQELAKSRMRKETDRGTDVAIALGHGKGLRHGDILSGGGITIIVEQIPEKVMRISLMGNDAESQIMLGHMIGNMHRPIAIRDGMVSVPVQSDSELETFERLFSGMANHIELSISEEIFVPHADADVHGH